jgi:hypothetical protein
MAKESKGELILAEKQFDYSPLEAGTAEKVRASANRIRQAVKRTIDDIIEVGTELLSVKDALPHGQFIPWVRAEFGWTERTAQNFMAVSERFGKNEMISQMQIEPTAAYLLAAPSAPDEAREAAIKRAESGERITAKVAKKILAEERKKPARRRSGVSAEKLREKLETVLTQLRDQSNQKELSELAAKLREFADSLEKRDAPKRRSKA